MSIYGAEIQFWNGREDRDYSRYTKLYAESEGQVDNEIAAIIKAETETGAELIDASICVFYVYEPEMLTDGRTVGDVQRERLEMELTSVDAMYSVTPRFV